MPEIEFLLGPEEQLRQTEFLLEQGVACVPRLRYAEPGYVTLARADEIHKTAISPEFVGSFCLLRPDFTQYDLKVRPMEYQGVVVHHIVSRWGGPYLEFMPSRVIRNGEYMIAGFVSFYSTYWISSPDREIPAPPELRALHKSMLAWLRDHGRQVVTRKVGRRYWIGPEAEAMLRSGVQSNIDGLVL